ncbi:MAG: RNA-binding protein [Gammaproteobacteria bacterium]|nr:RNA-binding protein [Gammaproteobacteria bacterium]
MIEGAAAARLDRWLWAARFFRTRAQAKQAIEGGKVQVTGARAKPSRAVHIGDEISISRGEERIDIAVRALSESRGGAPAAQLLYEESPASIARRATMKEERRFDRHIYSAPQRRPSKRDRRALSRLKANASDED